LARTLRRDMEHYLPFMYRWRSVHGGSGHV
jgi:hypothetical protein